MGTNRVYLGVRGGGADVAARLRGMLNLPERAPGPLLPAETLPDTPSVIFSTPVTTSG